MKKRILSMLLALVMLATLLPLGLIDTAEAAAGAQILTPTSGTSGTGANGGTWKCSSAGDTLTLTDYDGYPIETDATTIRFSGTNTITVPRSNLSGALRVYGLKLTSTKDIWIRGEDDSCLNIVFTPGSGAEDVDVSGIDADGPLLIDTAGDITISAPYGSPYGIRARQGLDYSGPGALDITVKGSYFIKSQHWCAAYGIAAEKGNISLSGSGSKTIRVQSYATPLQISSTPYGIYHWGGTGSSGTATISVDTGALHIEMNGDGCGIYNMGSADSAYVNINNVPELSIEKADSAIETAYSGTVNVRNSKLRIANGRYAIRNSGGTINMENADVTAAVRGSSVGYTDAAVYTGTLQVKGSSTVDTTATYGTVVYARAVSVNLSNGSFTAKTGQSKWPPIDAPVTLGVKTRLMTGVCSDADTGKYDGTQVDDLYVTSFASVESGTCGENVKWTLDASGTLTISGKGAMKNYYHDTPWSWYGSKVKTVIIEYGVTNIGEYAFSDCSSLTSVTIPDSVTSIGEDAFSCCKSLTSVTIPGSVTSIGSSAFYGCSSLTDVYYDGYGIDWLKANGRRCGIPDSATVHFKDDLYGKGTCGESVNWIMTGDGILTISGTGAMADYSWDGAPWHGFWSQVKTVVIENGVTSIGERAFCDCSSLTSVTIPSSVTSIGWDAFSNCSSLTDVYYDGYGIDWLAVGGHGQIPDSATVHFKDDLYGKGECGIHVNWVMTADGTLTISGTGRISNYDDNNSAPWEKCRDYIKCVVIKPGVRGIGADAFYDCKSLTSVTIPNSVTSIGERAFSGCLSLTGVTIPNSVTSIGNSAFSGCSSLTSVTIPNSVTNIESSTFYNCSSLTGVTIPSSVTSIGDWAFSGCSSLTSVTIPNSVTSIGWYAFSGCTSLTSVTIPDSVTSIGRNAFKNCTSLTTLTIPDSVTSIGWGAFENCTSLTGVKLPSALQWINSEMFSNCVRLTSVTIPKSVTSIGEKAFYYCDSLTDVHYGGSKADWAKITIKNGNEDLQNAALHTKEPAAPANVTLTGAKAVNGGIQVTWQAAANAATYNVYRMGPGDTCWKVVSVKQSGTSYTDKNVTAGSTYKYTVRGVASDGKTLSPGFNNTGVSATMPKPVTAPAFVELTDAKAASGSITVTWNKADGAVKYRVYRKAEGETKWTGIANVSGTSYTDTNVQDRILYCYTVRGIAADGTLSPDYDRYGIGTTAFTKLAQGKCGENLTWTLTSDNTLTISGKGAMYDYGKSSSSGGVTPPWIAAGYRNAVSYVRIETGVTYVGQNAFADCSSITDVSFPYTLEEIGDCAFQNCTMLYSLFLPYKTVSTGNGSTITAPSVIGNAAFRGCVRLRSVYLPVTIKAIGTSAFADCFALNDVGYTGSESDWEAISIGDGNIPLTTASIRYNVIYSSPKTG